jgi:dimethylargininase
MDLGLKISYLDEGLTEAYPDACFVEDTAIIHGQKALIARRARESRQGEEDHVAEVLSQELQVKRSAAPATIEGGDVIHLPDRLICGITQRTNEEGVAQLRDFLGVPVDTILDQSIVHLKSHVTYLGQDTMISTKKFAEHPVLKDFEVLVVPEEEVYAANTLAVRGKVLMADGHLRTQALVREVGFDVVSVDVSEFEKCEGALTCLSLLY